MAAVAPLRTPPPRPVAASIRLLGLLLPVVLAGVLRAGPPESAPTVQVIRVGVESFNDPISFGDSRQQSAGYAVDLLRAVARDQGLRVEFVLLDWPVLMQEFRAGRLDAIVNAAASPDRASYMEFSTPTLLMDAGVFYRDGTPPVRTERDMSGRRMAVARASRASEYVEERHLPVMIVPLPTLRSGLDAVQDGQADLLIATRLTVRYLLRHGEYSHVRESSLVLPDYIYRMGFAVHKGDAALLARLNAGLFNLSRSGEYDAIYEKWIGPLQPRPLRWTDVKLYVYLAGLLALLSLGVLVWQRRVLRLAKLQAEALRRSEERLQLVFDSTRDGFWDFDVRADQAVRSPRWSEMLGYAHGEVPATMAGFMDLVHPDDRASQRVGLENANRGADYFQHELRVKCKNGDWKWVLSRGKIVARDPKTGQALRLAGTHTDITERKFAEIEAERMQEKMLEAQKLESLGILAGGIAHDFNNLLTVIMGNNALIRMEPGLTADVTRCLEKSQMAASRAAHLCRQLLAYAGRGAYVTERIELNRLVQETVRLLDEPLGRARVEFSLAPEQPAVMGDPSQIGQIVMNLVLNATEAIGSAPGVIRVSTGQVNLDTRAMPDALPAGSLAAGPHVYLEVSDTGAGMTKEIMARIFDPFYTTKFAGRGLGLAAALGIARIHHGGLTVSSTPGAGSVFRAYLPRAAPAPQADAKAAAGSASPFAPGRVLVADDDDQVRELTSALLSNFGYTPVPAPDGLDAVRLFSGSPETFAAVLLDITMPRLDGLSAMKQIRLARPGVPIILISGHSMQDTRRQLAQEGPGIEFLEKPFTVEALRSCLKRVAGHR